MISEEEYREINKDYETSGELVQKRIEYMHVLCENIIKEEVAKYVGNSKAHK